MSSIKITTESVTQAFRQAGASFQEAQTAGTRFNRLADLKKEKSKEGIANLYELVRSDVFGPTQAAGGPGAQPLDAAATDRANRVMFDAFKSLGMSGQIRKLGAAALNKLAIDLPSHDYEAMVKRVAGMAGWQNPAQKLAQKEGLDVLSMTWEDTDRTAGSVWGDNITDMYVEVETPNAKTGQSRSYNMPVIRRANFQDPTADINPENFMINVGNATGEPTRAVSLKEVLEDPTILMTDKKKWPKQDGQPVSLFAPGTDNQVLVSSQATFLPVSQSGGRATYKVHSHNYQSFFDKKKGPQPAVLTILVTREGASATIMGKDQGESRSYGEPLYFNQNGERAPLTAERASKSKVKADTTGGGQGNADQANRVLVIQIPLIPEVKKPRWGGGGPIFFEMATAKTATNIEDAVVGHGAIEGPFDETMGKGWRRDTATPIRVTVQLTKATSNGAITAAQMKEIKAELDAVYENASRVGSLVVPEKPNLPPNGNPGPLPPFPFPTIPTPIPFNPIPVTATPKAE